MLIDLSKACEWLEANTHKYIHDFEVSRYKPPRLAIGGKCWEDFRKAMGAVIKESLNTVRNAPEARPEF